jgi:hypothetical protein
MADATGGKPAPPIPWRQRQELPCPVDPNCKIDHLRRKRKPKGRRDA